MRARAVIGMAVAAVGLVVAVASMARAPEAGAGLQLPALCLGDLEAEEVPIEPGPRLRFGINPAGEAGALGPRVEPVPDDPQKTLAALRRLDPPRAPFYVRLNRLFWSDGEQGIQRFLGLARRYAREGFRVEIQLRYHPRPAQEGRIGDWVAYVREVVRRFGANPAVRAIQVTNEVNFAISPDSSDGSYRGAREALTEGVIAAKDEAQRRGYERLEIGFNWFYRMDPVSEQIFWSHLRAAGQRFARAVDWVGLDAYPGTFFPPIEIGDGYRDAMVNALSVLRDCFMPIAGIGAEVPIKVEENGYPTLPPLRTYEAQVRAMRQMVGAAHDYRSTFNVSDYRWFDLRDHRTSSLNFQHQYGLLRDDYAPKPAFDAYRKLVRALSP